MDIEKTALPKEILGRIGDIIILNELSKKDYRAILLHSNKSPLKRYEKMLKANGMKLKLSKEEIDAIIEKASKSPYGARSLNQALKPYVDKVLYEAPSKNR